MSPLIIESQQKEIGIKFRDRKRKKLRENKKVYERALTRLFQKSMFCTHVESRILQHIPLISSIKYISSCPEICLRGQEWKRMRERLAKESCGDYKTSRVGLCKKNRGFVNSWNQRNCFF